MSNIPMIIAMVLAALFLVWMGYRVFIEDDEEEDAENPEEDGAESSEAK